MFGDDRKMTTDGGRHKHGQGSRKNSKVWSSAGRAFATTRPLRQHRDRDPCEFRRLKPNEDDDERHGNKGAGRASYLMNGLSRGSRLKKQRGVNMASVVHPMTRSRTIYPNRALVRHAAHRKNFLSRRLVLLCDRDRRGASRRKVGSESSLAIRPGRFPTA